MSDEVQTGSTTVISKESAKEAPVKFGFGAITMPTPQLATKIFRFVLYAAALTTLILPMFPEIPENLAAKIGNWALRGVAIVHGVSKLFGIDISQIIPPSNKS